MTSSSSCSPPPTSSSPGDTPETELAGGAPRDAAREGEHRPAPPPEPPAGESVGPVAIDLCGEICPFTFVRAKLALESLAIGAELRVIVDHEPAIRNVPRSASEWGQEVLGVTALAPGTWAIDLRKRVR